MQGGEIIERDSPGPIRVVNRPGPKYEKYLPDHLVDSYNESVDDPQLLHLHREIALVDVRIKELAGRLDRETLSEVEIINQLREEFGNDIPPALLVRLSGYIFTLLPTGYVDNQTFRRLQTLANRYETSVANRDMRKADGSLRLLLRVLHEERRAGEIWDELQKALDRRKALAQAEQKYLVEISQLISVDKAVTVLAATIDALREAVFKYVDDSEVRRHLLADAERRYAAIFGSGEAPGRDANSMD